MSRDISTPPVAEAADPALARRPHSPQTREGGGCSATSIGCLVILLVVVGVGGYFGYLWWTNQKSKGPTTAPSRTMPVLAAAAHRGNMSLFLRELGTVTPLSTFTVRSRVDGEVMKISFIEGQSVKAGQVLAEIDPRPFEVQLDQANAQLAHDQATLKNAQADLSRYRGAPETVSKQQIDTQAAVVEQDQAVIKTDQALIDNAKLQISYCQIKAPVAGRIGFRQVDVGNIVHATDAMGLAVITQIQPIAVVFTVSESQIARVVHSMSAIPGGKLPVEAYDENDQTQIAAGTLSALDNQVDSSTGTVKLKAEFANDDLVLFPNEFVMAHLLVETVRDAILIPTAAVQHGPPPNDTFVYVVKSDDTVELRNVKVGQTNELEGRTVVLSGLDAGEVVVTDGVDKLIPGAKVAVQMEGSAGATSRPAGGRRGGHGRGGSPVTKPAAASAPTPRASG